MKAFIDCGAHKGRATNRFRECIGDLENWQIHCFECNPVRSRKYGDACVHKEAVWIYDKKKSFYFAKHGKQSPSCSLMKSKKTSSHARASVQAIDFSRWLQASFSKKDTVYVKMDIEGAEYAVLNRMMEKGTIRLVNKLFVEFHYKQIGKPVEDHKRFEARLRNVTGLRVYGDFIGKCLRWKKQHGKEPAEFLK